MTRPPSALEAPDTGRKRTVRREACALAAILGFGLVLMFHAQIRSGWTVGLGHPNDPRLVNYLLEHTLDCMGRPGLIGCLANPPFFYPERQVALRSETFWGVAPLYWTCRLFSADPQVAYLFYVMLLTALNFAAAWLLFRHGFELGSVASATAAFLFAFAGPRSAILHQSFSCVQFPWLLALFAMTRAFLREKPPSNRLLYPALFWAGLAWQTYSYLYSAWFGSLFIALAGSVALIHRRMRFQVSKRLRRDWVLWLLGLLGYAVLVAPLVGGYRSQQEQNELASWEWVSSRLPQPASWLNVGPRSPAWGFLQSTSFIRDLPHPTWQALGLGLLTTIICGAGLLLLRRRKWSLVVTVPALILVVLATKLPSGLTLWRVVYDYFPGAFAFRFVHRVYQIVLVPAAMGFGYAIADLYRRRTLGRVLAVVLLLLAAFEQYRSEWSYALEERSAISSAIATSIPESCESFFYSPIGGDNIHLVAQLDAMWAARAAGVPTINGFSGYKPRLWNLKRQIVYSRGDESRIRSSLRDWLRFSGLDRTCWLRVAWSGSTPVHSALEMVDAIASEAAAPR